MFYHLIKQSRTLLGAALLASLISGVCSVLLVTQINAALTAEAGAETAAQAWRFALIAVAAMLGRMAAMVLFEHLSQSAHAQLRIFICGRVLGAQFRSLEEVGGPRVQSALSEHSARVAEFFQSIPAILINTTIVSGCLVYMAWLSWQIFLAAAVVIGLGSFGYHLAHLRAIRHLNSAAKEQDRLFDHFRSLVDGAKELRLNACKREHFQNQVLGTSIDTLRRQRAMGMSIFLVSSSWGNFLIYAFIGLVLFVLVGDVPERARIMTGFALVFVYMVLPLEALLQSLPRANLARVAAARIEGTLRELKSGETLASPRPPVPFKSLVLRGLCHRYYRESEDDMFVLGPIDLEFRPGQITYLAGGNGCGKTTLAKLLAGLYTPEAGSVLLDGTEVTDANRDSYRQQISAVFSDFHLFERLLDAPAADLDARANQLLTKLHLHHKVQVRDGAFTTRSLSQGQRKRLALVVVYLEDRPLVIFDEWAADQDPLFKEVFYRELLPELKAMDKAVLVISHDDRYFDQADRLIHMDNGMITAIEDFENVGRFARQGQ